MGLRFTSMLTLLLGESKLSTTVYIADSDTFGQGWTLLDTPKWLTETVYQLSLGTYDEDLGDSGGRLQGQRHKGEIVSIDTNRP